MRDKSSPLSAKCGNSSRAEESIPARSSFDPQLPSPGPAAPGFRHQLAYVQDKDGKDLGLAVVAPGDDRQPARLIGFVVEDPLPP